MIIENEIKSKEITLEVVAWEEGYYPSFRIKVGVKTQEMSGVFDRDTWISEVDINTFMESLIDFNTTRIGEVSLRSMNPNAFQLRFFSLDALGHVAVELQLKKKVVQAISLEESFCITFEIDPTVLKSIITELSILKA